MTEDERKEYIMLYTLCVLDGLIEKGFVEGPRVVTEEGFEEYERLKAEGFQPTREEFTSAMNAITGASPDIH